MENHDYKYNKKQGVRRNKGQSTLELILWRIKHTLVLLAFTVLMISVMLAVVAFFVARIRTGGL
jgi:hypothetical protein